MKKYTQADFDEMVRGQIVFLYCESGDWSEVDFHGANKVMFSCEIAKLKADNARLKNIVAHTGSAAYREES